MFLRRKPLTTGSLLILVLNLFTGEAVTCRRAEYRIGEECCPMCPPGERVHEHCTEDRTTSCTPCTEGTFLDELNGLTQCFPCTDCKEGAGLKVKRSCTTTSDAHCEPLEGYYCTDLTHDGCIAAQKHRTCKPGQYISQRGTAASDTVCIDCTGETYSDGTFTSCQPHTICESIGLSQIKPGNHSTDSECGKQSTTIPTTTIIIITIIIISSIIVLAVISFVVICLIKRKKQETNKEQTKEVKRNPKADITRSEETCERDIMMMESPPTDNERDQTI
ncbi:tumor necrosis factor receptor superfamily member 14-like isoform 3-T3 [Polymixia lowei]